MNAKRFTLVLFLALSILFTVTACGAKSKTIVEVKKGPTQAAGHPANKVVVEQERIVTQEVSKVEKGLEAPLAVQATAAPASIPTPGR